MRRQRVFATDPPQPADRNELRQNLVDAIATGDMRVLLLSVDRDGASLPEIEVARKQVELTTAELSNAWRTYRNRADAAVRSKDGTALLDAWFTPALFDDTDQIGNLR